MSLGLYETIFFVIWAVSTLATVVFTSRWLLRFSHHEVWGAVVFDVPRGTTLLQLEPRAHWAWATFVAFVCAASI